MRTPTLRRLVAAVLTAAGVAAGLTIAVTPAYAALPAQHPVIGQWDTDSAYSNLEIDAAGNGYIRGATNCGTPGQRIIRNLVPTGDLTARGEQTTIVPSTCAQGALRQVDLAVDPDDRGVMTATYPDGLVVTYLRVDTPARIVLEGCDKLRCYGWAYDPDVLSPIDVHLYVDGRFAAAVTADRASEPEVRPTGAHRFEWAHYRPRVDRSRPVVAYAIGVRPDGSGSDANPPSVPTDVPAVPECAVPASTTLFRGDGRGPDVIFRDGFRRPPGGGEDLLAYAEGADPADSVYVGTSRGLDVPTAAAWENPFGLDGFVYDITQGGGMDVNCVLEAESPVPQEEEVVFVDETGTGGVEPRNIAQARPATSRDTLGPAVPNPEYAP